MVQKQAAEHTEASQQKHEITLLDKVRAEIMQHQKLISRQSYLQRGVGVFYHPGDQSLHKLEIIKSQLEANPAAQEAPDPNSAAQKKSVETEIETDRRNLEKQLTVAGITAGAISVAPLLLPGGGVALSAAINALNTASPADGYVQQATDAVLGAVKGVGLKKLSLLGESLPGGYIVKPVLVAPIQTVAESTLNTHQYIDPDSDKVDIAGGLENAFSPYNIGASVVSVLVAGKAVNSLNQKLGQAISDIPFIATQASAAIYGFSQGITDDVKDHFARGKPLAPTALLEDGLERASIAMVVAGTGYGLKAAYDSSLKLPDVKETKHDLVHTISVGNDKRSFTVHVGDGVDTNSGSAQPNMCVIANHGCFWNADYMAQTTRLNELADDHGFIAVYPQGTAYGDGQHRVWGGSVPNWKSLNLAKEAKDLEFMDGINKFMQNNYNTDPHQTYFTGYSAGGMLALQYAIQNPDRVGAVASVSAGLSGDEAIPGNMPPLLQIYGRDDAVVPENGRKGVINVRSRRGDYQALLEAKRITGKSTVSRNNDAVRISSADGTVNQVVVMRATRGASWGDSLGHDWYRPEVLEAGAQFSATSEIVDFFLRQQARQADSNAPNIANAKAI